MRNIWNMEIYSSKSCLSLSFNKQLLKERQLVEESQVAKTSVLNDLRQFLQAPSVTFENIFKCLSFAARFHLETLKIGEKERAALQVLRTILTLLMQLPNRKVSRATIMLMKKYERLLLWLNIKVFATFSSADQFRNTEWFDINLPTMLIKMFSTTKILTWKN